MNLRGGPEGSFDSRCSLGMGILTGCPVEITGIREMEQIPPTAGRRGKPGWASGMVRFRRAIPVGDLQHGDRPVLSAG